VKTRDTRGFTLIELLVVIAIISILASILFPAFSKARDRATTTACMNNMKQIGIALYTYLGDYDEAFPMNRMPDASHPITGSLEGSSRNWRTALFSYINNREVLSCPTNRYSRFKEESGNYPISYSYNGSMFHENSYRFNTPTRISRVKDPSGTLFIIESRTTFPDLGPWAWDSNITAYNNQQVGPFHVHGNKRMNCVFADTHAKAVSLPETMTQDLWKDSRAIYKGDNLKAIINKMHSEYR